MAKETDTETRLKTLLKELGTLQGKVSGIATEAERLRQQRNKELVMELLVLLKDLARAIERGPMKVYGEIQKRLTALEDNDPKYFSKLSDRKNPYSLKFKDIAEERFIIGLFGNSLTPGKSFEKFLAYIAGRSGKDGNIFFSRKEGDQ